jgi:hypothetical protein
MMGPVVRLEVMKRRHFLAGLCGVGFIACSPAPVPISQSKRDPSSPSAPEGAPPPPIATTTSAPAAAGHEGHSGHGREAPAPKEGQTVYVCPMHPEVTSTQPGGVCPKCNMKLVPKR